jgi:hypothetical protein
MSASAVLHIRVTLHPHSCQSQALLRVTLTLRRLQHHKAIDHAAYSIANSEHVSNTVPGHTDWAHSIPNYATTDN